MNVKHSQIGRFWGRVAQMGGLAAVVLAVAFGGNFASAWGPERQTFTIEKPASYVTFNSITNNPNYGDERNFLLIKDAAITTPGGWKDTVEVEADKEYLVRLYVHNNAAANYNLEAVNTRVMVNVPTTLGNSVRIDGSVLADNANPKQVWDNVVMTSDKKFNVAYVQGSAVYYNNVDPSGTRKLSDSIVTSSGALVGYEALDGKVKGCFEYSGIATFRVKVQMQKTPNFTVDKKVRVAGTSEWVDNLKAKPGDRLEYSIMYTNTGEVQQNDVVVKDSLDSKIGYEKGSSQLKNATNPNKIKVSDKLFEESGMNVGNYATNSNAIVYYFANLPSSDKLACGVNKLKNIAKVETDHGSKTDTSEVEVVRDDCTKPIEVCDLDSKLITTIDEKDFDSKKHSKDVKDCRIKVCNLETKTVIEIDGKDFDEEKHSKDLDACAATPAELPRTGPAAAIIIMIVLAAAAFTAAHMMRQRKQVTSPKSRLLEKHLEAKAKPAKKIIKK